LTVERVEGKTEATAQAQSLEEGSRPGSFDWQIPGKIGPLHLKPGAPI